MGYRVAVLSLCEHGEGGFLPLRDEGRGEKFHEGSHNAEAVDDTFVEPGRSGEARRKFLVQNVVFVAEQAGGDRKSTRLNSSHVAISYAVFCLKKKKN